MLGWLMNLGFAASEASVTVPDSEGIEWTLPVNRLHYALPENRTHYTLPVNRLHWYFEDRD